MSAGVSLNGFGRAIVAVEAERAAAAPALACYHPLSCRACQNLGAACGSHVAGTPGAHAHCTGQPAAGFQAGAL